MYHKKKCHSLDHIDFSFNTFTQSKYNANNSFVTKKILLKKYVTKDDNNSFEYITYLL